MILGGKASEKGIDLSKLKRKFDDRRRRRQVVVTVARYVPHPHYYVSVKQEFNPVWCLCATFPERASGHWHEFSDDSDGRGESYYEHFNTAAAAYRWAQRIITRKFSERHTVEWAHGCKRWFYGEGD